jgi:hypothetical protein
MASYWRRRGQPRGGPARAQVPPASLVLASAWVRHSAWHATLFAALDITNGRVLAQCRARHRHPELLGFPSISTPTYRRPSMSTSSSTITSRTNPPKCLSGSPAGPVSTSLSHRLIHPAQSGPALVRFTQSAPDPPRIVRQCQRPRSQNRDLRRCLLRRDRPVRVDATSDATLEKVEENLQGY